MPEWRAVTATQAFTRRIAALEVRSRFAANPKWLIYLPPTMSPSETTKEPGLLEHPREAFAYFRNAGVAKVVCEEKHMGSRAVVVVCRDADAARRRFGVIGDETGIVYTRTGRRFFDDAAVEAELLELLRRAMTASGFWDRFETDWACLDCELMPWSAKAQELIDRQYAAVGAAATSALPEALGALQLAQSRGLDVAPLVSRYAERLELATSYEAAYQRYSWPVASVSDLRLAPFHLLATEGKVHTDRDHVWHMETLAEVCRAEPSDVLFATPYKEVDVTNPESEAAAIAWWEEMTGRGGEGMVVKPFDFIATSGRGLMQPVVKCRGREYLRIIYGPEYTLPENLDGFRRRGAEREAQSGATGVRTGGGAKGLSGL